VLFYCLYDPQLFSKLIKPSESFFGWKGIVVLSSIRQRWVLLASALFTLLVLPFAGAVYLLYQLDNAVPVTLWGLLLICALASVVLAWFMWRPVGAALQQLEELARQPDACVLVWPSSGLAEVDALGQSLVRSAQQRQQVLNHLTQVMQGLSQGQLHQSALDSGHSDGQQLVAAARAGLSHVQDWMDGLHQFIDALYNEVHDTALAGQSLTSTWQDHPLLGPALAKMGQGHLQLLKTVHDMTTVVEKSSITLADLSWQANTINREMKALAAKGAQISASSRSLADNSSLVSADAASVAQLAQQARDNSHLGQLELSRTIESMRQMGARTQLVSTSITGLQSSSQKIEHIVQLIRDIANKINLLSLNAAIEAARAGEHGKGFAVVSDEVRKLAEKTFEATQEIDASVGGIMSQTGQAVGNMNDLLGDVQANVGQIEQVGQRLSGILDSSNVLSEQMDGIVHASSQSAQEVAKISSYLGEIQDELASFGVRIESQENQTQALTELSEGFYEKLVDLNLETTHSRMFVVARAAADAVQAVFEQAVAQGTISQADLLSQEHEPIPGTNPIKYTSRFDAFTDRVLPAIQEKVLAAHPQLVFAICTNKRAYVPTHNDKFAKPLTGRYEVDLVNSRSKRIFSDRTGSRCGSHTQKMLLQTYKRDTGEIMHDLSVPIRVAGTHWGGFRMGYKAD